jgi:hypothetical protein
MTVPTARQPNNEPGLLDQTNIALNLFNIILQTTNNRVDLEHSWVTIKRHQYLGKLGVSTETVEKPTIAFTFLSVFIIFLAPSVFSDALTVYFRALKYKLMNNMSCLVC